MLVMINGCNSGQDIVPLWCDSLPYFLANSPLFYSALFYSIVSLSKVMMMILTLMLC